MFMLIPQRMSLVLTVTKETDNVHSVCAVQSAIFHFQAQFSQHGPRALFFGVANAHCARSHCAAFFVAGRFEAGVLRRRVRALEINNASVAELLYATHLKCAELSSYGLESHHSHHYLRSINNA
jgi:hypothetical protein